MMLDLDHFKAVNDTYGHLVGDEVLEGCAGTLRSQINPGDLVGRFGGEEFGILLPGVPADAAQAIAERIRTAVAAACLSPEHPALRVTASFGVTGLGPADPHFGAVYSRADRALYTAKQQGRNCCCVLYSGEMAANP